MLKPDGFVDLENGLVDRRIFVDDDIYRLELEQIFARSWVFLAHETQIPNPGDFVSTYVGEEPVLVTRSRTGEIRALLNTCRHRGNRVCREDEGHVTSFTCPYHGWSYDTDGNLIGVPGYRELYKGKLNRDQWGLVRAHVESYKGLVFGNFAQDPPPLVDYLGDMTWALDLMVDSRAGGVEVVPGVFKWTVDCNWKFAADNFIGDNYHASTTHLSAEMVGHAVASRVARSRRSGGIETRGFTLDTTLGHGLNANLHEPQEETAAEAGAHNDILRHYFQETNQEAVDRLGDYRANRIHRFNATVFPNASFSSSSGMIHVWHPRGPLQTEVWNYTLVDRDASPAVKDAMRLRAQRHFSPAGLFEQDDGENWEQSTQACLGVIAQKYPFNYQMGLGDEEVLPPEDGISGRIDGLVNEHNQRTFYRRWTELMTADGEGES